MTPLQITTYDSAAEISNLVIAANKVKRLNHNGPTVMMLKSNALCDSRRKI